MPTAAQTTLFEHAFGTGSDCEDPDMDGVFDEITDGQLAAFAGREKTLAAYEQAKLHGYRFYSYGDAMLIL